MGILDVEGEILSLSPDAFARWVAYFTLKRKESDKARARAQAKAKTGGKGFRGR